MTALKNTTVYILFVFFAMDHVSGQNNSLADTYFLQATDFKKTMKTDSALIYYKKASVLCKADL